jgi:RHS repeat-associated protein
MTDSSGTVAWAADYKPFGEATVTVSTITNNLRFPGQYFDAETGLNYNYFRDYNPVIGRYIEADPIGLRGGISLYMYALGNPLYWIDSSGLLTRPVIPGPVRPPDAGASEGGACGANRTRNGHNYPHAGVDLLAPANGSVVAPIPGTVSPSGGEGILICRTEGTICCNGSQRPKLICYRLVHIAPTVTSGGVTEGQNVGTVLPQSNPNIPPHVHVEYYETTCNGMQRSCPNF